MQPMPSPPPCAPQASRSDVAGEARWDLDKVAVYQDPHTYKALDMDVVHRIVALVLANEAGRIEQDSVNDASLHCVPPGSAGRVGGAAPLLGPRRSHGPKGAPPAPACASSLTAA